MGKCNYKYKGQEFESKDTLLKYIAKETVLESKRDQFFRYFPNLSEKGFINNYDPSQYRNLNRLANRYGLRIKADKTNGRDWAYIYSKNRNKALSKKEINDHFKNFGDFSSLIDPSKASVFDEVVKKSKKNTISVAEVEDRELNAQISKVLFNGIHRNMSAVDVIRNIKESNASVSGLLLKMLPKLLKTKATVKFVSKSSLKNADTYMQYNPSTDTIEVSEENLHMVQNVNQAVAKFLHEAIHSVLFRSVNNPNTAQKRELVASVEALFSKFKETANEEDLSTYSHEISSLDEFIAGIFEDTVFKEKVENTNKSAWNKLIDSIKRFLGLDTSFDKVIKDILALTEINEVSPTFTSDVILESKTKEERDTERATDYQLEKVDILIRRLVDNIKSYANISKRGNTSYFEKVDELHKDLQKRLQKDVNDLNKVEYLKVIHKFLKFSTETFHNTNARLDKVRKEDKYDQNELEDLFRKSTSYINSFDILEDLKELLLELNADGVVSDFVKDSLMKEFRFISSRKNEIGLKLTAISKKIVVKNLLKSKYNQKVEIDFRNKYAKEAEEKYGVEGFFRGKRSAEYKALKDQYVAEKLAENRELIEEESVKHIRKLIDNPTIDLSNAAFRFNSDPVINNAYIQMVHNLLMESNDNYKREILPIMHILSNKEKELKLTKADVLNISEVDDKGNFFLKGKYKLEYYTEYQRLQKETYIENPVHKKKAVAKLKRWLKANSIKNKKTKKYRPRDKWLNDLSNLSSKQKEALDLFKGITEISREDTEYRNSLIKSINDKNEGEFYRMPAILKTTYANAMEGKMFEAFKKKLREGFVIEKDDVEEGMSLKEKKQADAFKVYSDVSGKPIDNLAVNYRNYIGDKQNLDLFTIYAMEAENGVRFKNNYKIESTALIFKEFIKSRKFIHTTGMSKIPIISQFKNADLKDYDSVSGELSNTYKKIDSMIKNRVYSIVNVYAGNINGTDANRAVASLISYSSFLGMAVNIPGATSNLITGMLGNFIDSHGGDITSKKDIKEAFKFYTANMPGMLADIGEPVPKNIINQLLQRFDVMGEYSQLRNQFERNNKVKKLLKGDSATGLHGMGEHAMHAVMMLSILKSTKVMNKESKWINKDGKVVSKLSEAASLMDMFYVDSADNNILKEKEFAYTQFDPMNTWNDGGSISIKGLIKDRVYRTQGAYDTSMNAHWQKFWYGKLFLHFKRFFEPLMLNRFRGVGFAFKDVKDLTDAEKYYNFNSRQIEYGYYTTFIRTLTQTIKQNRFNILNYRGSLKEQWKDMTDHERANIRKSTLEISVLVLVTTLAALFAAAGDDGDDDMVWFLAYLTRRQRNEIAQFADPREAWRIINNPIASVRQLESLTDILGLLMSPFEIGDVYESGVNAGQSKTKIKFLKTVQPSVFRFDAHRMYNFYDKN